MNVPISKMLEDAGLKIIELRHEIQNDSNKLLSEKKIQAFRSKKYILIERSAYQNKSHKFQS
jgi:hypothetical protein